MLPSYLRGERFALEQICRQHCQTARLSDRALLCRVLGKYIVYADPDDVGITPHFCLDGFWESWITIAMARLLQPGWYCVDIGANHGYYTLIMADAVGATGRVLALEPNPQLAALLALSVEVNGFQRYTQVVPQAAFDAGAQRLHLVIPHRRGLNATLCREATASDTVVEVETVTLDQLTADWPRVDLVKIDAEGAEEAIWRGMQQTVERHRQLTVVLEMNCQRYADSHGFLHSIQDAGFVLRHIDYDGTIQPVTLPQLLTERAGTDWMLCLRRE